MLLLPHSLLLGINALSGIKLMLCKFFLFDDGFSEVGSLGFKFQKRLMPFLFVLNKHISTLALSYVSRLTLSFTL